MSLTSEESKKLLEKKLLKYLGQDFKNQKLKEKEIEVMLKRQEQSFSMMATAFIEWIKEVSDSSVEINSGNGKAFGNIKLPSELSTLLPKMNRNLKVNLKVEIESCEGKVK